jgi:hypothetical protein
MFSINQVAPIQDDIARTIMEERMRYAHVYEETEKYLAAHAHTKDNVVMLGGRIGVQLILGRERSTDTFMFHYELYAENPFKHANDLTNDISKVLSPKGVWKEGEFMIWLKTFESASGASGGTAKYGIYVDNRPLVTIIGVPRGTVNIVRPNMVKSFDKKKEFAVLPAEIQLLDIYRVLYSPGEVDLWEEYLSDENQLFQHLRDREKIIHGAKEASAKDLSYTDRKRVVNVIMQKFIANNPKVILLGEHALYILDNEPIKTHVLHVCTTMDPSDLIAELQVLPGVPELKFSERPLNIMKDHRLNRITIKTSEATGAKEIMYAYNSASYDLLPFNTVKADTSDVSSTFMQLANPFVVLRFLLVEIWMVRRILAQGKIDETFAKQRITAMLQKVLKLRKQMSEGSASDKTITTISDSYFGATAEEEGMKIFQMSTDDYIGVFVSEIAHQKRTASSTKKYPDYMPQRHYADTGSYRTLAH